MWAICASTLQCEVRSLHQDEVCGVWSRFNADRPALAGGALQEELDRAKAWSGRRHGVAKEFIDSAGKSQERGGSSDAIPIGRQGVDGDSEKW